jgi:hypothetical protein
MTPKEVLKHLHDGLKQGLGVTYLTLLEETPETEQVYPMMWHQYISEGTYTSLSSLLFNPDDKGETLMVTVQVGVPGDSVIKETEMDVQIQKWYPEGGCIVGDLRDVESKEELVEEGKRYATYMAHRIADEGHAAALHTVEGQRLMALMKESPEKVHEWLVSEKALDRLVAKTYLEGAHRVGQ